MGLENWDFVCWLVFELCLHGGFVIPFKMFRQSSIVSIFSMILYISFSTSQNRKKVMIWWGFFRLTTPALQLMCHVNFLANSCFVLKKGAKYEVRIINKIFKKNHMRESWKVHATVQLLQKWHQFTSYSRIRGLRICE